jgi:formyltetrahydrofolate deformylase
VGNGNTAVLESAVAEVARRFDMKWDIFYDSKIKRVAVFVSKMDHCLWDLLIRHQAGKSCAASANILLLKQP